MPGVGALTVSTALRFADKLFTSRTFIREREDFTMANHNPGARAFLLIVLGGIVIGFVIAAFLLSGNESETAVEEPAASSQPAEAPAAAAEEPADDAAMSGDDSSDDNMTDESTSDDMSTPDEAPDDVMPDDAAPDDVSPPDEMPDDAMPDDVPDAITPGENSEQPVTQEPAPAPNP